MAEVTVKIQWEGAIQGLHQVALAYEEPFTPFPVQSLTFTPDQEGMEVKFSMPPDVEEEVEQIEWRVHIMPDDARWEYVALLQKMATSFASFATRDGVWQKWVEKFFEAELRKRFG